MQTFPIELAADFGSPARGFPNGKEAVAIGTRIGAGRELGQQVYMIDLASGVVRPLVQGSLGGKPYRNIGVSHDGRSVLVAVAAGNLVRIAAVGRNGRVLAPSLFTVMSSLYSLDSGADGSIYLDQVERPVDLVRFSARGGHAERIATLPAYEAPGSPQDDDESFAVLPDGRVVATQGTGGRKQLMVVEAGKDPIPLINTAEETSAPVTAAGPNQIAFLIGPEPLRTIALAATSNGLIARRIPFDKGEITSLASAPDGKTLYCAAGGNIWSIAVESGADKKIRAGDHVAVDPEGKYLLAEVTETPIIRLIRVPLGGGPEREIPRPGPLRPAFILGPNAIGKDGRVLMPLGTSTWRWPPGVLDPVTGKFTQIAVDDPVDYHVLNWTPDGQVLALGLGMRSKMWKFHRGAGRR